MCFYLTNSFHFAVVCSVIDAQMSSQRGKMRPMRVTESSVSLMLLPRSDVFCASITKQTIAKWKLFALYNKSSNAGSFKIFWDFRGIKKDINKSADVYNLTWIWRLATEMVPDILFVHVKH